jgi:hypothetical protein
MEGAVHAILLLVLLAVTAIAVGRTYRRPSGRRLAGALCAGVAGSLILGSWMIHLCGNGQAFTQWLIPSACVTLSVAFIGPSALRRGIIAVSLVLSLLLTWHYVGVVHGPDFVGTQAAEGFTGPTRREWHSWISGLYRRTGPPPDRRSAKPGQD